MNQWDVTSIICDQKWRHPGFLEAYPLDPSGKLSHNYGKTQLLMGKFTISMTIFNSKLLVYQRVVGAMMIITPFDFGVVYFLGHIDCLFVGISL